MYNYTKHFQKTMKKWNLRTVFIDFSKFMKWLVALGQKKKYVFFSGYPTIPAKKYQP